MDKRFSFLRLFGRNLFSTPEAPKIYPSKRSKDRPQMPRTPPARKVDDVLNSKPRIVGGNIM